MFYCAGLCIDHILGWLNYTMGLLNFHCTYKILFAVHFKDFSFWPSADVKPMKNHPVHVCSLSLCVNIDLYATSAGPKGCMAKIWVLMTVKVFSPNFLYIYESISLVL